MKIQNISGFINEKNQSVPEFIPRDTEWLELKIFKCNRKNELYSFRKHTTEHYLVLDGILWVQGKEYSSGTLLTYYPGERRSFFVIKDVTCISIKDPSLCKEDKLEDDSICLRDFISPYFIEGKKLDERYNNIKYEDISVVIQGAIDDKFTPMSIESVRTFLPGAGVIISTWKGTDVSKLDYDDIVFNDDPGAPFFDKNNGTRHYDNRNRLLVSTQGGIKRVNTEYTLKMRSDCILCGDGIVRNYGKYPKSTEELKIFKKKLVVGEQCNIMKLLFKDSYRPFVFHVSDWFCFGLTDDVRMYFDGIEIESVDQMTKWKYKNDLYIPEDDIMGQNFSPRYNSEQYYFLSALRKKYDIPYEDASDYSEEIGKLSDRAIVNNFEVLNIKDHEIINAKKQNKQAWDLEKSKEAEFFTNKKYEKVYSEL